MPRRTLSPQAALGVDIALAVLVVAAGLARELLLPHQPSRLVVGPLGWYVAVHLLAGVLLLRRRQNPLTVGAAVAALGVLTPGYGGLVAAYSVGAFSRHPRWKWVVLVALVAGWSVGAQVWRIPLLGDRFTGPSMLVGAALLGLYVGARRRLVQALTERAERAERERELLAEQARGEERARLAAEMHDIVTHRVNLMVLQAGALRMSAPDDAVRGAAEELRRAGCQALAELRDLVGVLRSGRSAGTAAGAQDPTDGLDGLVAQSRAVGLVVELTEHGDPQVAAPAVRRTLYRVVQESLTNVRKHAPGAPTSVTVHYEPTRVRAAVRNAAPSGPPEPELGALGSGTGLIGLQQRAELVGGTLAAAPTAEGGFEVRVALPAYVPTAEHADARAGT